MISDQSLETRLERFCKGFSSPKTHSSFRCTQDQAYILFERWIMAGSYLPKTSESGRDIEPAEVLQIIALEIIFRMGSRTHNAHVAFEDIEELWQLVNTVLAEKTPEPGDARIVNDLESCAVALIHMHEAILLGIGIGTHGAEFITAEFTAFAAHAPGFIEDWPGRVDLDGNRCQQQQRRSNYQRHDADKEVH